MGGGEARDVGEGLKCPVCGEGMRMRDQKCRTGKKQYPEGKMDEGRKSNDLGNLRKEGQWKV